jgi:predicted nucleic-acid-binding Zn-ribbon protein
MSKFKDWIIDLETDRTSDLKKHTKVLCDYWGYKIPEDIECIVCGNQAVDTHHLIKRGMGSSKLLDVPSNLAPLCREHHQEAEFSKEYNDYVSDILKKKIAHKELN